ncbi:MAG: tape measure protein [Syntrophobacteraceae bacterium]
MAFNKRVTFQIDAQDNASSKLKSLEAQSKKLQQSTAPLTNGFKQNETAGKGLAASLSGLKGVMAGLATGSFAMLTKTAFQNASAMEQNRIAFETMLGSAEQAKILLGDMSEFARKTPFDLPQVVEGGRRLLAFNIEAGNLIPTLNALGNIAAGVGKEKLPELILAFGQVRAAGQLTGAELRQFTEAGVPLLEILAKQAGKSAAQIKDEMENGAAPSFAEVEKAIFSMSENGGKFFDLMGKQSQTLGGQMSNLKDNFFRLGNAIIGVSETGEIIEGGLFDVVRDRLFNTNKSLDDNYKTIVKWGSGIINGFVAVGRTLYNIVTGIARVITYPFVAAIAQVQDAIKTINNYLAGDYTISQEYAKAASEITKEGIVEDIGDIMSAWIEGADAVTASINSTGSAGGELKKSTGGVGEAFQKASKEAEQYADKLEDMQEKMEKASKEFKKAKKELRETFEEDKKQLKGELGENVAQVLYDKETELSGLKQDLMTEESDERKAELQTQIAAIEAFLAAHQADYQKYAKDLRDVRAFEALDEIGQLKSKHAEEQKELKKKYKQDLEDLKDNYKEKRKELVKELEKIKAEYAKFLDSKTMKKAITLLGKPDTSSVSVKYTYDESGNAVPQFAEGTNSVKYTYDESGNAVPQFAEGTNRVPEDMLAYLHKDEAVVPKQYNPAVNPQSSSSPSIYVDLRGATITDQDLIQRLTQAIGRQLELSRYGIG